MNIGRTYRRVLPVLAYAAWLRIQVQFARTLLGSGWIGLSALLTTAVLGGIYGTLTRVADWPAYWAYVALGLVGWNTLAGAVNASCTVLERGRERLLNQPLPLGGIVLEEWLTSCVALLIGLGAVLAVLGLVRPQLWLALAGAGALGLVNLLLGCLLLSLLIAPAAVWLADLPQLVPIVLQIGFLASPILFYSRSLGPLAWVSHWNPLYLWVMLARDPFLGQPHWPAQLLALPLQLLLIALLLWALERRRMAVLRWL
ncbi:MAG: hypothetical protein FJ077_03945 [Cyanobacteria bacterium K_DeepCast_35m_m2_023]|nr:hypothetical protein [Cyanobacteria bacterium K_DeepCast_35m_m2_023]